MLMLTLRELASKLASNEGIPVSDTSKSRGSLREMWEYLSYETAKPVDLNKLSQEERIDLNAQELVLIDMGFVYQPYWERRSPSPFLVATADNTRPPLTTVLQVLPTGNCYALDLYSPKKVQCKPIMPVSKV